MGTTASLPLPASPALSAEAKAMLSERAGGITLPAFEKLVADVGIGAVLGGRRLEGLFAFLDADSNGTIDEADLRSSFGLLGGLLALLTDPPEAAKPSGDGGGHAEDESKLPPQLRGFVPIAKAPEVKARMDECAALEAAAADDPDSAEAVAALTAHAEGALQPAIQAAISAMLETPGIVAQCDRVIDAGQGFDNFYTSAYKDTIETAEGEGIAALASEVGRIELPERDECVQPTAEPIKLFLSGARIRKRARKVMEVIAAEVPTVRLEAQGPLKKLGRIFEKIWLRPAGSRGRAERVCDVVRDMFVAPSMADVAAVVRALCASGDIVIVRVKDRFTTPSAGGWRDLMINYKLVGSEHVCEVQICHASLLLARKGLPGHVVYGRVRNCNELKEFLGLLDALHHGAAVAALRSQEGWSTARIVALGGIGAGALYEGGCPMAELVAAGVASSEAALATRVS